MENHHISRRQLFSTGTKTALAAGVFEIIKPELVRGAGQEKLKAGLIGFGGRGRQAIVDLLSGTENVEVVAVGDIFEDHVEANMKWLNDPRHAKIKDRVKISPENRFIGFDAYKKVINSDIDIVMLATPPGYRPMHFEAAIEARKHVFCEKPFGTDATGVRRFMAAAKKSEELKLTVMSGAQRRHDPKYQITIDKLKNGAIGDITAAYAYWVGTPVIQQKARDDKWGDMTWQHRAWYSHLWLCGDQIVEQHLHNIDVINWLMGGPPKKVMAIGGASWRPREEIYGHIYDHIGADFEYPNGVRMSSYCRQYPTIGNLARKVDELVIGTKGRSNAHDLSGITATTIPYMHEHTAMAKSIRGDGPYINHAMAVAESTLTCIMARESAYSGMEVTWEMIMNSKQDLLPKEFDYDLKMQAMPLPVPGTYKFI